MTDQTITVIGRDNGNKGYEAVLIYTVEADPKDEDAVRDAFIEARESDMGELDQDDRDEIEVLFAFPGDIDTIADWRG